MNPVAPTRFCCQLQALNMQLYQDTAASMLSRVCAIVQTCSTAQVDALQAGLLVGIANA